MKLKEMTNCPGCKSDNIRIDFECWENTCSIEFECQKCACILESAELFTQKDLDKVYDIWLNSAFNLNDNIIKSWSSEVFLFGRI